MAPRSLQAATQDIYVYSFDFSVTLPGMPVVDAVITVGDTVRWVWIEGNHTTTAVAGIVEQWDGALNSSNPTYSHTFTHLGTFYYYCRPHGFDNGDGTSGGMSGTITVLPAGSGACCLSEGGCAVTTPASCQMQGGIYDGDGTTCLPNPCPNQPVTVTLTAVKDNTLYEDATGAISNGAGQYFFTGNQSNGNKRRGVVAFDLSSIPSTALVQSATLRLFVNQAPGSSTDVSLHRLTATWGEGTSDANGNESSGTTATTNDATWLHRFYNTNLWSVSGGEFVATASATLSVPAVAGVSQQWSSADLTADVQGWVDGTRLNAGWTIRGDEASSANARRFDSRESSTSANRPALVVTYLPETPVGACCLASGNCVTVTASQCAAQSGTYHGDGIACGAVSCPIALTPFVDALPRPAVAQPVTGQAGGAAYYEIAMTEAMQKLHRDLPATRVWGYGGSYPGPTIEARHGLPVSVKWTNNLRVFETQQLRTTHVLPVDTCLDGPDMTGNVPVTVTHLHGGHVPVDSDGFPELVFPPGQSAPIYNYPNIQSAATIWYHDHAMGITRLNVYMGLAAFYLIRDGVEDALNLPRGEFEIAMAIQDRSFNSDGSLRYQQMWMDHFFGDYILVNGKVWPYLNVKQGKYRFRLLDGSSSRAYTLALSNGATFWQIGSDLGLLPAPISMTSLTLLPGERADVVMDFAPYAAGTEIILTNSAPCPFPGGGSGPDIPNVMKFVVQGQAGDIDSLPASLVPITRIPEAQSSLQRDMELAVGSNPCPDHHDGMWTINGLTFDDITEFPELGTTEIWAWRNRSAVTHPMHMHLVNFQVLDRQPFDVVTGQPTGPRVAPAPNEMGWKDTVQAPPGQITRVIARFEDFWGSYPYHCHILEHEDHEMMRQFTVVCNSPVIQAQPAAQPVCVGIPANFSVSASGTLPFSYQWRKDSVNIAGATTSTYAIASTTLADAGSYDCVVTNACGIATSTPAALTVNSPPSFNTQPAPLTRDTGQTADFSVSAAGAAPLSYEWRKDNVPLVDGGNISGALTAQVTIANVELADQGAYACNVSNPCGSMLSDAASLTVIVPCPGDLTGDRQVALDDLAILLGNYGKQNATPAQGDLNGDHVIDLADLAIMLSNYGRSCG